MVGKILAYVLGVALLGALLAPPLYWAAMWAAPLWPQLGLHAIPFGRYANRSVMGVALVLLPWLLRALGIRRVADLGLGGNPRRWQDLGAGVGLAVACVGALAVTLWASGSLVAKTDRTLLAVAGSLLGALGTAVAVALIEETFFRGALLGALRRRMAKRRALVFVSVLFALVHVPQSPGRYGCGHAITWCSGFEHLASAFARAGAPGLGMVALALSTLVLLGALCGVAVLRTGSLYLAWGLHGGVVWTWRVLQQNTVRVGAADLWLGEGMRAGVGPLVLMSVLWGLTHAYLRQRARQIGEY